MNATSNSLTILLSLAFAAATDNAYAVARPNPSLEERTQESELVVVADAVEPQPFVGREFDKFYRARFRVASVLKGNAAVGDRLEVVVNNSIAEHRNDCCTSGQVYVMFLSKHDGRYYFVGGPLGAIPVELSQAP